MVLRSKTQCAAPAQGLQWYKSRMQQDADGDVAHQFLSEQASPQEPKRPRTCRERPLPPLQVGRFTAET